ncbi:DNA topoisomerase IB [Granulosicoccus sp. 3-233]|uniref:DNA topoisomerase IB n=1 Tax=Granulosicoccus sp. 3-233 TaxID=3417969 RepID=UPI003D32B629
MADGLVYARLDEPGYTRVRRGRGFSYLGLSGKPLKRQSLIDYCRSLVIPPAWEEVWISPIQNAHVLGTGLDEAGRKQYLYHPEWSRIRSARKFDDLLSFGKCLPALRKQLEQDMKAPRYSRKRVIATTVRLIDKTLVRVGNEQYVRSNGSRGATTLTPGAATVSDEQVILNFKGKSGIRHHLVLEDEALARSIAYCQELPGQRLFQYLDEEGERCDVDSSDVNDYLREHCGEAFTAKHFRTWGASAEACQFLVDNPVEKAEGKQRETAMVKRVADILGNTVTVSRQYYIHPLLLETARSCCSIKVSGRALSGMSRSESRLLRLLKQKS